MSFGCWRPQFWALAAGIVSLGGTAMAQTRPQNVRPIMTGPVLPAALVPEKRSYLRLGLGTERFGNGSTDSDYLAAISGIYRYRAFGPNATFLAKPNLGSGDYEKSRFLLGLGLRGYAPLLGTEVSYGVGVLGELRFEEHFWLIQGTPIELSAVLYRRRTFEIELSAGMRVVLAGKLINSFLLDPNGFRNEDAQADLDRARHEDRARGFIRLIFSRRLD